MGVRRTVRGKDVRVKAYARVRFDKLEHINRHKRGPRSKSPGGYKKRNYGRGRRKQRRVS